MSAFDLLLFIILVALMMFAPILIARIAQKLEVHINRRLDARSPTPRSGQPYSAEHTPPPRSLEALPTRLPPRETAKHKLVKRNELAHRSRVMTTSAHHRMAAIKKWTGTSRRILSRPIDVRRGFIVAILLGPPRSIDPMQ
jgi:hypothetical protein